MYLYLDESGDLGFDFKNKKPSRFFVITCTEYGVVLGGGSPLRAVETGSVSLGKGVHREVESEES